MPTEPQDGNLTRVETKWGAVEVQPAGGYVSLRLVSPEGDCTQLNLVAEQATKVAQALMPLFALEQANTELASLREAGEDMMRALKRFQEATQEADSDMEGSTWAVNAILSMRAVENFATLLDPSSSDTPAVKE